MFIDRQTGKLKSVYTLGCVCVCVGGGGGGGGYGYDKKNSMNKTKHE